GGDAEQVGVEQPPQLVDVRFDLRPAVPDEPRSSVLFTAGLADAGQVSGEQLFSGHEGRCLPARRNGEPGPGSSRASLTRGRPSNGPSSARTPWWGGGRRARRRAPTASAAPPFSECPSDEARPTR